MPTPEKMLDIKEFASQSNYSERLIRQYCLEGKIEGAFKLSDKSRKWLIPTSALQKLKPRLKETTNRKPEPQHGTSSDTSTGYDHQSEILSKLVRNLNHVKDIAKEMTGSAGYGMKKEDYREPFQKAINLAQDEFNSGRILLPVDFIKGVEAFFQKITEINIEFETAIDAHAPNGPQRAQYWKKAGTLANQEIPKLLDVIENQARMMIAEIFNSANTRPSIEVTPHRDSNDYSIEVKNNGNVADFEAQIEIIKDATGYDRGKLYLGYWEFGQGPKSTFGNIDKIKIAHLETMVPPRGAQAIAPFFMTLQLYYSEKSGTASPSSWNSTSWTISENNAILKPEYILRVTISSNPPLREGKFIKDYRLNFEGLTEVSLV